LSRFRFFALFATLAAMATVFAACGSSASDTGSSDEDPQKVIESASLEGVKSGNLDLALHIKAEGDEGGDVDVSLSGPFEMGSKEELPQLELSADVSGSADGEDIDFEGGLTLLTDRAFIAYGGNDYEVDPTTFGFLKAAFERTQQQGGEENVTACQEAAEGIKFSQFADNLETAGSADVDGTSTTKVSGDLNASGFFDAVVKLTEDPACSAQLEAAGPLPIGELEEAKDEISKSVVKTHVDLYVGDDNIIRKVVAELTVAPPEADGDKVEFELELTLSGVNEEQSFSTPSNTKPLEDLFDELGVDPLKLLEAAQGEGLGGLLEGIGGGSSSGGSGGSGSNAYAECLQSAQTTADLQKCAGLRQ
jgi:hypothetical protein